ncbi:MAG: hypothetical protein A2096_15940 [Spirochaetes bacterium GWF1_41_5]|nr:MAG: hypothetical protein A2096_15940 [Spirochaetes bacterium GWF1_41_5]
MKVHYINLLRFPSKSGTFTNHKYHSCIRQHSFYEICFCFKGTFDLVTDNRKYEIQAEMCYILSSGLKHAEITETNKKSIILFIGLGGFNKNFFHNRLIMKDNADDIKEICINIINEKEINQTNNTIIPHEIKRIFYLMKRHQLNINSDYQKTLKINNYNIPLWIQKNIDEWKRYINTNYNKTDIKIAESPNVFNMSFRYFEKYFKILECMTCSEYLNQARVNNAKHLLLNSDLTMHEIARQTGFKSSNYFIRKFKKLSGVTPKRYRITTELKYD